MGSRNRRSNIEKKQWNSQDDTDTYIPGQQLYKRSTASCLNWSNRLGAPGNVPRKKKIELINIPRFQCNEMFILLFYKEIQRRLLTPGNTKLYTSNTTKINEIAEL